MKSINAAVLFFILSSSLLLELHGAEIESFSIAMPPYTSFTGTTAGVRFLAVGSPHRARFNFTMSCSPGDGFQTAIHTNALEYHDHASEREQKITSFVSNGDPSCRKLDRTIAQLSNHKNTAGHEMQMEFELSRNRRSGILSTAVTLKRIKFLSTDESEGYAEYLIDPKSPPVASISERWKPSESAD